MPYTIAEFAKRNKISKRTVYNEAADGRLIITKIRDRSIITDENEAAWLASLPTIGGKAGDLALRAAAQAAENLAYFEACGLADPHVSAQTVREAVARGRARALTA